MPCPDYLHFCLHVSLHCALFGTPTFHKLCSLVTLLSLLIRVLQGILLFVYCLPLSNLCAISKVRAESISNFADSTALQMQTTCKPVLYHFWLEIMAFTSLCQLIQNSNISLCQFPWLCLLNLSLLKIRLYQAWKWPLHFFSIYCISSSLRWWYLSNLIYQWHLRWGICITDTDLLFIALIHQTEWDEIVQTSFPSRPLSLRE